jgi:hypothetical protein
MAGTLMFNIAKAEILDYSDSDGVAELAENSAWSSAVDLGKTRGGGNLRQEIEEMEIDSDQSADPEYIAVKKANKTVSLNLLEASPANLALAFGGVVDDEDTDLMKIPNLPQGLERAMRITTQEINGTKYQIIIPRIKIKGNAEVAFDKENPTVLPLEGTVLAPAKGDYSTAVLKIDE